MLSTRTPLDIIVKFGIPSVNLTAARGFTVMKITAKTDDSLHSIVDTISSHLPRVPHIFRGLVLYGADERAYNTLAAAISAVVDESSDEKNARGKRPKTSKHTQIALDAEIAAGCQRDLELALTLESENLALRAQLEEDEKLARELAENPDGCAVVPVQPKSLKPTTPVRSAQPKSLKPTTPVKPRSVYAPSSIHQPAPEAVVKAACHQVEAAMATNPNNIPKITPGNRVKLTNYVGSIIRGRSTDASVIASVVDYLLVSRA